MAIPNSKRIISCAITGSIHVPSMSPYLPITPDEIAQNAIDAASAGAAIVHIHARNPETGQPSPDMNLYRQIIEKIRAKNEDVMICITTGGGAGMTVEQRAAVIPEFKPELASMNAGSINWGLFPAKEKIKEFKFPWESQMLDMTKNFVFENTFAAMEKVCKIMSENGTKPELEVYDTGHLYNIAYLIQAGIVKPPITMQFVTGILGGISSTPYDIMNLHTTAERLFGKGQYAWSVIGAGKAEYPAAIMALILGGHVRVGLEDNLYLGKGTLAKNNAQLVEKMARIMGELDLEPATPQEARELLGLPRK
ncbi:3-keto-5-aminohexanoate cleavage protein [Anaerosporomusa subterranea]|uniref:3-keto-5-aminohexanoate cleavage protein n=1 Tax=Anaerosporomusa subterranea TaxID=1794912 RepID=A0A154BRD3_ANASB|nr:3-keto-5-aminohexanoate cleavage protein [Anaerosporomusa subterranea]KYZ76459.1 3-keto-5-aminohexanoate cleavage protein [Anaerosporomusa subterranea]